MNAVDQIPVILRHLGKADVAQNARVVDQDVDAPKGVDRGLYNLVAIFNRVVVGHSLAAHGLDLGDHFVSSCRAFALTGVATTEIVYNDLGATTAQQQCMSAAQAVSRAGDNRNFPIEPQFLTHRVPSFGSCRLAGQSRSAANRATVRNGRKHRGTVGLQSTAKRAVRDKPTST